MKSRILMCIALLLLPVLAVAQAPAPPPPVPHPPGGGNVYFQTQGPGASGKSRVYFRAWASEDLGAWWKDSEIVRQIQLTDAQVRQIEQTFLDARLKLIDLNADVQRQETLLQPLVDADQVDEAKISAQLDQVLAARTKLEKSKMMLMFDIRKVLTVEQWKKLQQIQHERPPRGGVRGGVPGEGPHGPGPGPATPPPGDDDL